MKNIKTYESWVFGKQSDDTVRRLTDRIKSNFTMDKLDNPNGDGHYFDTFTYDDIKVSQRMDYLNPIYQYDIWYKGKKLKASSKVVYPLFKFFRKKFKEGRDVDYNATIGELENTMDNFDRLRR